MQKQMRFGAALFTVICFAIFVFIAVVCWDISPHIPMLLGCIVASAVALLQGCQWKVIQQGMVDSIAQSLESLIILLMISVLMGVWIQSGVVPVMIYYGLKIISPGIFLPCTMIVTSLISMIVGSWGAAGTLGLAFMGIAQALGIPSALAAGAVISGAYVGDQLSPLSDSTNLTSAVVGVNVFDHVRYLFPVNFAAYLIAAVGFLFVGLQYGKGDMSVVLQNTGVFLKNISNAFHITPLMFLPMVLMVVCILRKVPATLSIMVGILSAGTLGMIFQGNDLKDLMVAAKNGYVGATGNELVDHLLTAGGLDSMMASISLIIIAMMFGGIMEKSGQMKALTAPIVKRVHSLPAMTASVILTCILVNIIMPDQYVAIALPGRMYINEYDCQGIDHRRLGMALSGGAVATSSLVPWNTCGTFMCSVLGVSAFAYARYAFFNMLSPLLVILLISFLTHKEKNLTQTRR
ncbi:MAG: Na+/H+ antiporter NhaC family protein [Lawsonibacter sp.]|nr:Na+/H+ antiporter NhaC family protein [Lawsonibacter sp.]